jgi:methyl-accepting chemotaxis protein
MSMGTRVATGTSILSQTEAATKGALRAGMASLQDEPSIGILFGSSKHDLKKALATAAETMPRTSFVGASTAGEITERGFTRGGMTAILISSDDMATSIKTAHGISRDHAKAAATLCSDLESKTKDALVRGLANSTTVLFADTLTSPAEWLVNSMRKLSKPHHRIVGGAPADDGALKATYTGTPGHTDVDSATALHLFTRHPWGIGVEHGLRPVTEKKAVTKAKGPVIEEIDGKPAFRMFEDYIRQQGLHVPADKMVEFVIRNELGVFFFDDICKVRAIHQIRPDGALVSTGEIPVGSSICIVTGDPEALVQASRRAAEQAQKSLAGAKAAGVLVFSCFCRTLILGNDFKRELEVIRDVFPGTPIGGFVTYGEIARFSGKLDGYHNTTVVVAAIPA